MRKGRGRQRRGEEEALAVKVAALRLLMTINIMMKFSDRKLAVISGMKKMRNVGV